MTITYLKSLAPIKVSLRKIPDSINLDEINGLRQVLISYFPELKSFSILDHVGENFFDLPICHEPKLVETWEHTPGCNFHLGKMESLIDKSVLLNYFSCILEEKMTESVATPLFKFLHGKEQISNILNNLVSGEVSAILMPFKTSKRELHQWIDDYWPEIRKSNQKLPEFAPKYVPSNLVIGEEIVKMRLENKSFDDISIELFEKYPEDQRLADPNQVKMIFHRSAEFITKSLNNIKTLKSLKGNAK